MRQTMSIALGVFLASCAASPGSAPSPMSSATSLSVSSLGATYPLTAELQGNYRIIGDTIYVTVTRGMVRNNAPRNLGDRGTFFDLSVQVGLGVPTETGWRIDRRGTDVPVAAAITADGEAAVGTLEFVLPIESTIDLSERWIYFALRARHTGLFNLEPGLFASYVCATDNLLGPTPASQDREGRMAEAYSTAC